MSRIQFTEEELKHMDRLAAEMRATSPIAAPSAGAGTPSSPLIPRATFDANGMRKHLDVDELIRDLLCGVESPSALLQEAAKQVAVALRWGSLIDDAHLARIVFDNGNWNTAQSFSHARVVREYQQLLSQRQLTFHLLLSRHEALQARIQVSATSKKRRLRPLRAA